MKRFKFLLFLPLVLGSCSLAKKEQNFSSKNIEIPEADHEYFEVEYVSINWNDILNQNKDTYYVYIYSQTCNHCNEFKNWIIDQALARDDIFFVRSSKSDVIKTSVESTIGATDIKDIAILGYPTLLQINNKTLVKNLAGNQKIQDAIKFG